MSQERFSRLAILSTEKDILIKLDYGILINKFVS